MSDILSYLTTVPDALAGWLSWSTMGTLDRLFLVLNVLLVAAVAYEYVVSRRLRHIPGPPRKFIIGNVLELVSGEPWEKFRCWGEKYGGICKAWVFGTPMINIGSPEAMKYVLGTNRANFHKAKIAYDAFKPLLGIGLVTSEGEVWRKNRHIMAPAFRFDSIKALVPDFYRATVNQISRWDAMLASSPSGSIEVDVSAAFRDLTLEIIGKAALGMSPEQTADLPGVFFSVVSEMNSRFWYPYRAYLPTLSNLRYHQELSKLDAKIRNTIRERRVKGPEEHPTDILGFLLKAQFDAGEKDSKDVLTDERLVGELKTMLLAGHETSSMWLTWTMYVLSDPKYSDVLNKILDEIKALAPEDDKDLDYEQLRKFNYLDMVLRESLRLYAPVPVLMRTAVEDDEIEGMFIPKGSTLLLNIHSCHMDPEQWETPRSFNPEHFAPNTKRHTYAWLPFSLGLRDCLGQQFAKLEALLVMIMLLRRYKFDAIPGFDASPQPYDVPVHPANGLVVRISRR